ncbi:hypothetical protein C8Q75DRAFT_809263 [Abortiporus biennis]|nr:hypothetical protein C8Q75DRAFT_809263 [Abortiporus biennis]
MSDETEVFWIDYYGTVSYSSMVALVVYDYSITIDREVENIWKKKFNLSSWIFIVNRYATLFAASGIAAFQMFPRTRLFSMLNDVNHYFDPLTGFYIIRTWAIWGQHPLPPLVLTPLAISVITLNGPRHMKAFPPFIQDAASAISITFSFFVLCGTLVKTLSLKRAAKQANLKSSLVSLLIRDEATLFNVDSEAADIVVLIGPITWLTHVIVSRMILDLKTIDQITMASIPDLAGLSNRFSSIHFVGNIGAPLDTLSIREPSDNDMGESFEITTSFVAVSAKQAIENPLSIGLFDERYDIMSSGSQTGLAIGA